MPRNPQLTDLQLILLSTASARDDRQLYPLKASIAGKSDDVAAAITALLRRNLVQKVEVRDISQAWMEQDGLRIGLVIADRARALIEGQDMEASHGGDTAPTPSNPRSGSKAKLVLTLLGREKGASPAELIDATGWLPHTMRAALTGLRKKGHVIERDGQGEGSVYRLIARA